MADIISKEVLVPLEEDKKCTTYQHEVGQDNVCGQNCIIAFGGHFEDDKTCQIQVGAWYEDKESSYLKGDIRKWKVIKPITLGEKDSRFKITLQKIDEGWESFEDVSNKEISREDISQYGDSVANEQFILKYSGSSEDQVNASAIAINGVHCSVVYWLDESGFKDTVDLKITIAEDAATEKFTNGERYKLWNAARRPMTDKIERSTWNQLCEMLDEETSDSRNWRGLASQLKLYEMQTGMPKPGDSPTGHLLSFVFADLFSHLSQICVLNKLIKLFEEIGNEGAKKLIQKELSKMPKKLPDHQSDSGVSNLFTDKSDVTLETASAFTSNSTDTDCRSADSNLGNGYRQSRSTLVNDANDSKTPLYIPTHMQEQSILQRQISSQPLQQHKLQQSKDDIKIVSRLSTEFPKESNCEEVIQRFNTFADGCDIGKLYNEDTFAGSVFDEKGGYLKIPQKGVVLYIPPDAIEYGHRQPVYCYVKDNTSNKISSSQVITPIVDCGPDGTTFKRNVVLALPHQAEAVKSLHVDAVIKKSDGSMASLPNHTMLVENNRVFLFLEHFTKFFVTGKATKQIALSLNNFKPDTLIELCIGASSNVGKVFAGKTEVLQLSGGATHLEINLEVTEPTEIRAQDLPRDKVPGKGKCTNEEAFKLWYPQWQPLDHCISGDCWRSLCECLDVQREDANDWRSLADHFGLSVLQIQLLEQRNDQTSILLAFYCSKLVDGKTNHQIMENLLHIFKKMENHPACTIVEEEIQKIDKSREWHSGNQEVQNSTDKLSDPTQETPSINDEPIQKIEESGEQHSSDQEVQNSIDKLSDPTQETPSIDDEPGIQKIEESGEQHSSDQEVQNPSDKLCDQTQETPSINDEPIHKIEERREQYTSNLK